ncbi:hypothetical protein SAMCFNEI73_Ch1267 [Sinorhizobium americanum]|uniref:Uncharacterized protein n=1 Tax=Sinorhizobium americanum TaxID=194963 RepID=A0A1L3LKG2_9HYPH|nr:hypothetical protein SAMCCGM7_Ch1257 [Sinorhizobium americanum CCGM7]APG90580.1 hypothetical protein SAMCFNEI73_Ch1267 [Sinorhizobium americanum]
MHHCVVPCEKCWIAGVSRACCGDFWRSSRSSKEGLRGSTELRRCLPPTSSCIDPHPQPTELQCDPNTKPGEFISPSRMTDVPRGSCFPENYLRKSMAATRGLGKCLRRVLHSVVGRDSCRGEPVAVARMHGTKPFAAFWRRRQHSTG